MADPMRIFSDIELSEILASFQDYLVCQRISRQYGSRLEFYLGSLFGQSIKKYGKVMSGASELLLEGYDWKIVDRMHKPVAESETISDDEVRDKLAPVFVNSRLLSLQFNSERKELVIGFSNDLLIYSVSQLTGEYVDDALCLWTLPDGRILSCDAQRGFYWDGSMSEDHVRRYAEGQF